MKVSLKIAKCQKALLNYEEALVILKTCFKTVKKKAAKSLTDSLISEYFTVAHEYISVLIHMNRFEEAHELVAEAIESIDISKKPSIYQKKITGLVIFKAQIFLKLGYLEDAYGFFSKVQAILADAGETHPEVESAQHMAFSEAVDYLECILGQVAVEIELSKYEKAKTILDRCDKVINGIFRSKDSEMARRIKIFRLQIARDTMDFEGRSKIADELSDLYQSYDHYRLLRCDDFMHFVKERVAYLAEECKFDAALVRVENIIKVLEERKAHYWLDQFRILQARCLLGMRRPRKAYEILQDILHNRVLKKDSAPKMKDHRLFLDVHLQLGSNMLRQATLTINLKSSRILTSA